MSWRAGGGLETGKETDRAERIHTGQALDIRDRAEELSKQTSIHPAWSRAYLALADAADRLDAAIARAEAQPIGRGD